ncbi:hypothetical protein [uncultured Parasutterella sp.]|uniref:hypothetical protein n=1 Tax=uncultured Parasutterella sp. TaxID=1263098 RepID=UPI0025918CB8|nr:hypothetical protein [uncultured Parasutterella sp.]
MSLYNNVSESVSSSGGFSFGGGNVLQNMASGAIGGAVGTAVAAAGGGALANRIGGAVQSMATNAANQAINRFVPASIQKAINLGAGVGGDLLNGDWEGAALKVWDSGIIADLMPDFGGGLARQAAYWGRKTALFGGITPSEARDIYRQARSEVYCRKNLFLIEVTSQLNGGGNNISERFNLFATDVEYQPYVITGEAQKIGGANVDIVQGSEPVNLSITTFDDDVGTLKRWFANHQGAASCRDGTVNEPGKYAIRFRIVHGYCKDSSSAYEDIGLFRPVDLSVSLSRHEDGLAELQMQFAQLDTFVRP